MKKIASIAVLALTLSLSSCQQNSETDQDREIKEVAKNYAQALADYKPADAIPFATPETKQYTLDYFTYKVVPHLSDSLIQAGTPATIHIDRIKHISDTEATVFYHKVCPNNPHLKASIDMRLRNGHWLAHQLINPAPFFGGAVRTIDTAALHFKTDSVPLKVTPIQ